MDSAFEALKKLDVGQSLHVFNPIRQAVSQAHADEKVRADLEARLVSVLQGDATELARDYACCQLAIVGSDASVPVLKGLLQNRRSSHMARHAMEGVGSPAAIEALRESLTQTKGTARLGIVISLGRLADPGSVSPIAALLREDDLPLREAALVALGRIGTVEAADALRSFARHDPDTLSCALIDAQLSAAEQLRRRGNRTAAISLYETLSAAESPRARAAAFRGLILAAPAESAAVIIDALTAKEPWKREIAADCLQGLRDSGIVSVVAKAVPQMPSEVQVAALARLKHRSHPAIREAAMAAIDHADTKVRVAALEALILSAMAEDVPKLFDLASGAKRSPVGRSAVETLRLMSAEGTNQAIMTLMSDRKKLTPLLVQCALARRSSEFVPAFLKAAESTNKATRVEAFRALELMATDKEAESLARLLSKASPSEERVAAGRAAWMSCQKIPDPAQRATPLLRAFAEADAAGKLAILPTLARLGDKEALDAVHSAMKSEDRALRDVGYRALANWPDATVAEELLTIAKTSDMDTYRIWSLRAFSRVVSLPNECPPQQTFEMLNKAFTLAERTKDKKLILSRLASVRVREGLDLLLSQLNDPELGTAAVTAVFTLAKGLSQSHPEAARAALERIHPMTKDPAILQQIPKVLRDIEARQKATQDE